MANLIARSSGNLTDATTWAPCDPVSAFDTYSYSSSSYQNLTTTGATSPTFVPGAITIDGIALRLGTYSISVPTYAGTITVNLDQAGSPVAGTSVTINASDLNAYDFAIGSWHFFKFGAPVTLLAATSYGVKITSSSNSSYAVVYHNGSTNNFFKLLRMYATQAPVWSDALYIMGEYTAPATVNPITVVMNQTTAPNLTITNVVLTANVATITTQTDHGLQVGNQITVYNCSNATFNSSSTGNYAITAVPASNQISYAKTNANIGSTAATGNVASGYSGVSVGNNGTLNFEGNASTNYLLQIVDNGLFVNSGGTFQMGTLASPIPASSTAKLVLMPPTSGDFSVTIGQDCTFTVVGAAGRTYRTLLAADAGVGGTSITVEDATGWANGDQVVLSGTTNNGSHEQRAISNLSGNTMTVPALTYAHQGTAPVQAMVGNLTRNCVITSTSKTSQFIVRTYSSSYYFATSLITLRNAELSNMGYSVFRVFPYTRSGKTGTADIQNCALWGSTCLALQGSSYALAPATISKNVVYYGSDWDILVGSTNATSYVVSDNLAISTTGAYSGQLYVGDPGGTFTGNWAANHNNANYGAGIQIPNAAVSGGKFDGNWVSNCYKGFIFSSSGWSGTLANWKATRCTTGMIVGWPANGSTGVFDAWSIVGNGTGVLVDPSAAPYSTQTIFNNCTIDNDSVTQSGYGVYINSGGNGRVDRVIFRGCSFGQARAYTQGDLSFNWSFSNQCFVEMYNCKFSKPTVPLYFGGTSDPHSMGNLSYFSSDRHNQVDGGYFFIDKTGYQMSDTSLYRTNPPSIKAVPYSATLKVETGQFLVAVANGSNPTVSVYVRISSLAAGDSQDYNGNLPRLICRQNYSVGVTSDTVIATAANTPGTWQLLSGACPALTGSGVLSFAVDCDGTTGFVNVDEFSVSTNDVTGGLNYGMTGKPVALFGSPAAGGGGAGFPTYYAF